MEANEYDFENWIDDVRVQIYEETKHMNNAEIAAYMNAEGRKIAAKYGITRFKTSPNSPVVHLRHETESENSSI